MRLVLNAFLLLYPYAKPFHHVITDSLADGEWHPQLQDVKDRIKYVADLAIEFCRSQIT